ncbi:hypothetical protein QWM81_04535 [Streptomyces ficellus]|uniref:Prephenate dehydrogenase n=1 Tax=Streptomyces ficellus TaxID=1977088 RepID=A0ABT7Z1I1_9ACTN|nr:hypothetical protein [Streptomyces ficellus]MDN3293326.1 hypothetical protein [Streptomyces ficellus]
MPNPVTTAGSIEATTALLLEELPQLERQQQALEQDLAAVSDRLESVRGALAALQALSAAAVPAPRAHTEARTELAAAPEDQPAAEAAPEEAAREEAAPEGPESAESAATQDAPPAEGTSATRRKPRKSATGRKNTSKKPAPSAPKSRQRKKTGSVQPTTAKRSAGKASSAGVPEAGGLTEQVAAVLARNGDTPLRARDVAKALGRDGSTGAINTVRSTLDRLVATSRAHRAGRGLYQAPTG